MPKKLEPLIIEKVGPLAALDQGFEAFSKQTEGLAAHAETYYQTLFTNQKFIKPGVGVGVTFLIKKVGI